MAKVRVYELAKELNMTNNQLLVKIKELKIDAKSHMSALDNSAVAEIKQHLFGKKKRSSDVKVRPSVIRRRKAKSRPRTDDMDASEADDVESTENEPEAVEAIDAQSPAEIQADSVDKTEEAVPEAKDLAPEADPAATSEKEPVVKQPARKVVPKTSEPARIIKPARAAESVGQESEPPSDANQAQKEEVVASMAQEEEAEKISESAEADSHAETTGAAKPAEPADNAPERQVSESADTGKDGKDSVTTDMSDQKIYDSQAGDGDTGEEESAQTKRKKKKRKTTPAKIVRVADPAVLENIRKMTATDEKNNTGSNGNGQERNGRRHVEPAPGQPNLGKQDLAAPDNFSKDRRRGWDNGDPSSDAAGPSRKKRRKKKAVVEGDDLYQNRGRKKRGKKDPKGKKGGFQKTQITTPKAIKRRVKIDEAIELAELAKRMGIKANEMIVKLMGMGVMATVNQTIDYDTASLVAAEFDFEVEKASFEEETLLNVVPEVEDEGNMEECPPVVTIMGHVDHGKTSLLDVIRKSKITSGEAGGITQHIGAYNVETPNGGRITFLDTPGHAAFTAMRSRGAKVTDIVILVVAADDGVMPQTIEAINHAKAADVPVVVAVNKMDKAGADPDRIMRELSEHDLLAEDWGGNVIFVKVSAKSGEGIDELLEMVLLQAEVLELRANPDRNATGYVVESRLDTGRGAVATVLVKQGTLKDGDPIVCGLHSGHIRAMIDDTGNRVEAAGPSTPVEIVGLAGVPDAGDEFVAVASDKDAKQIAAHRMQKQRAKELAKKSRANLEKMFENLGTAEIKELKLIVKADVQGSIEALNDSLKDLAKEEVDVKIVHSAVGTINESDVSLAAVSDAIIIGFNVRPTPQIRRLAKDENVDMRFYDIIYDVINDIKAALDGMMPSTFQENIIGRADVRDTFVVPKIGTIAGCAVVEGRVVRGKKVRLLRDGIIKCDTELSSLRRFKDDVKEVEQGFECGIGLEKFNDIKVGDAIECYEVEEIKYQG